MAGKPIKIEYIAEVAQYLRETKKLEVSTEDIADALVATSNSADDLERKLSRAMRDAEKETEGLERAIKDLPKASDDAARGVKADMGKVEDAFADAGEESAQEFKQNLGESLSSGDLSSIIQDTAGGLVSGLKGPLALAAAALAAAAAVGLGELQKQMEEMTALTDSWLSTFRSNLTASREELDAATRESQYQDWIVENIDLIQKMDDELKAADISTEEYGRAMFEGGDAAEKLRGKLAGIRTTGREMVEQGGRLKPVYSDAADAAGDILRSMGPIAVVQKDAADEARVYAEATGTINRDLETMDTRLRNMPKLIPVEIKYTATGNTGGAFATSGGGQLRPIYAPKAGASG